MSSGGDGWAPSASTTTNLVGKPLILIMTIRCHILLRTCDLKLNIFLYYMENTLVFDIKAI